MENKIWRFKDLDGQEIIMNTKDIRSLYDILDRIRSSGSPVSGNKQTSNKKGKPEAVLIPFINRMSNDRRHSGLAHVYEYRTSRENEME